MSNFSKNNVQITIVPYNLIGNNYISSTKRILSLGGYEIRKLSFNLITLFHNRFIKKTNSIIIINWLEDRLGGNKYQFLVFIKIAILLTIYKIFFKKMIWVRHNFIPHGDYNLYLYELVIKILTFFSDEIITHRPVLNIKSVYIPHPLYEIGNYVTYDNKDIDFLYFGAIKKYKGLVELLNIWPSDIKFNIVGKCDDEVLASEINEIILSKNLLVSWVNDFISNDDLNNIISRSKSVILPHLDNSMIVSGSFYHAVSLGANVLVRDGQFYRDYLKRFSFVTPFELSSLPTILKTLKPLQAEVVINEVHRELSDIIITDEWSILFSKC